MKFVEDDVNFLNYEGNKFITELELLGFKKGEIPWEQYRTPWRLNYMLYPNRQRNEIAISYQVQPFNNRYVQIDLHKSSGDHIYQYFLCDDIDDIITLIRLSSGVKLSIGEIGKG
jgi:hypothetical protein